MRCVWFVNAIIALVKGDADAFGVRNNDADARNILATCHAMEDAGLNRTSRQGWSTVDHPRIGILQWKWGYNFRNAGEYFFLRVNGRLILKAWPDDDGRMTRCKWINAPQGVPDKVLVVERMLGTLKTGTGIGWPERDEEFSEFRRVFPHSHN